MDKKTIKDLKRYAWVGNLAISTFVTIVLGVIFGYLLDLLFDTSYLIIIVSIVFLFFAIANFIYRLYKIGSK